MKPVPPYTEQTYLKPGELCVCDKSTMVETVLGSCVAVSLYCPTRKVGAICHAMLPSGATDEYKYVDVAVRYMLDILQSRGVSMSSVVAKMFGGADMFAPSGALPQAKFAVGKQNVLMAHKILQHHNIQIRTKDTGGKQGRKLLFFSETGQVFIKKLNSNKNIRE